jgi:hypothetical protein
MWGGGTTPEQLIERRHGRGRILWGGEAATPTADLLRDHAQWIWAPEGNPAASAPGGATRHFRRIIPVDPRRTLLSAQVQLTADNEFTVKVNGAVVAQGDDFRTVYTADITARLKAGDNEMAVAAVNTGSDPNPAGLIAVVQVRYADGTSEVWGTDESWRVAAPPGAEETPAMTLGPAGMTPWNLGGGRAEELYPSYAVAAAWLEREGVAPVFASTGPVRHHQRRTKTHDLFFVANREAQAVEAPGVFRTDGAAPELWHPVTGERRPLPQWTVQDGGVSVPLRFAGHEGYFIVFDRTAASAAPVAAGVNFPEEDALAAIEGPYMVKFAPAWGGPNEPVRFDKLVAWNAHEDPRIRYYSGEACYQTTFDRPAGMVEGRRVFLDLGVVHKLARVKLNGKDLGIVWTPPYRVDVTGHLRPAGTNWK